MAEKESKPAVPSKEKSKEKAKPKAEYASAEEVKELSGAVSSLIDIVKELGEKMKAPTVPQTPEEIKYEGEVTKASVNRQENVPREWTEKAREILGDALDHCEVFYPKGGGTLFTMVIKKEFSNANQDYIERYKEDRRTKEIGNEGIEGVEQWCKLVSANLKRGK